MGNWYEANFYLGAAHNIRLDTTGAASSSWTRAVSGASANFAGFDDSEFLICRVGSAEIERWNKTTKAFISTYALTGIAKGIVSDNTTHYVLPAGRLSKYVNGVAGAFVALPGGGSGVDITRLPGFIYVVTTNAANRYLRYDNSLTLLNTVPQIGTETYGSYGNCIIPDGVSNIYGLFSEVSGGNTIVYVYKFTNAFAYVNRYAIGTHATGGGVQPVGITIVLNGTYLWCSYYRINVPAGGQYTYYYEKINLQTMTSDASFNAVVLAGNNLPYTLGSDYGLDVMMGRTRRSGAQSFAAGRGKIRRRYSTFNPADIL